MERAAMKRAAIDRAASCALSRRTHEQVSSHCGRCMKRGRSLGFKVTGGGSDSKGRWLAQGRLWDLGEPLWGTRNKGTSNNPPPSKIITAIENHKMKDYGGLRRITEDYARNTG